MGSNNSNHNLILPPEMKKKYIQRRIEEFGNFLNIINRTGEFPKSDFLTLRHQINGNAASFGYETLDKKVRLIKLDSTDELNIEIIKKQIQDILHYLDSELKLI